ncbi:MAG: hypothetical protein CYPHOPRED_000147 [Cyphobasidiales sp. Tagirdzhanova-0007]|nr:MAG: hypothetical protein CYPHOPRED_000147 [Cyphobasidiales sp. Tagirdzhanova-0007]
MLISKIVPSRKVDNKRKYVKEQVASATPSGRLVSSPSESSSASSSTSSLDISNKTTTGKGTSTSHNFICAPSLAAAFSTPVPDSQCTSFQSAGGRSQSAAANCQSASNQNRQFADMGDNTLPQLGRNGYEIAPTRQMQEVVMPCLAYGTPRTSVASEDFGRPPAYNPAGRQ